MPIRHSAGSYPLLHHHEELFACPCSILFQFCPHCLLLRWASATGVFLDGAAAQAYLMPNVIERREMILEDKPGGFRFSDRPDRAENDAIERSARCEPPQREFEQQTFLRVLGHCSMREAITCSYGNVDACVLKPKSCNCGISRIRDASCSDLIANRRFAEVSLFAVPFSRVERSANDSGHIPALC